VKLRLVLLPGRSAVTRPQSYSARLQDFLRRAILATAWSESVGVIDLLPPLRSRFDQGDRDLYHPNDGHLTSHGHEVVARILSRTLWEAR
jgi:hypothetical protein